jgi:hypothetical protein
VLSFLLLIVLLRLSRFPFLSCSLSRHGRLPRHIQVSVSQLVFVRLSLFSYRLHLFWLYFITLTSDAHSRGRHLTNRSSQTLAVLMSSFSMTSTLNSASKLAAASGS